MKFSVQINNEMSKQEKIGYKRKNGQIFYSERCKTYIRIFNAFWINIRVTTTFKWVIIQSFESCFLLKHELSHLIRSNDLNLLLTVIYYKIIVVSYLTRNRIFESKNEPSSNSKLQLHNRMTFFNETAHLFHDHKTKKFEKAAICYVL